MLEENKLSREDIKNLPEGTVINDRYQILAHIGNGGFADVFKAKDLIDKDSNKFVAIKLIYLKEHTGPAKKTLDIEKESFAKLMFSQNVVKMYDFDEWRGCFYMVIELVEEGIDLSKKMKKFGNEMSLEELLYYFEMIGMGLKEIHAAGIVHRDIKPQNILINQKDDVKISDFGISIVIDAFSKSFKTGFISPGTPRYAAPEQNYLRDEFFIQSDIYSVGVMLYQYATGTELFTHFNATMKNKNTKEVNEINNSLFLMHATEEVISPRNYNPNIPASLENVIMKCLAKDYKKRYNNFDEFLEDLRKVKLFPNAKEESIPMYISDPDMLKIVKSNNVHKQRKFFKMFNLKYIVPTIIGISLLAITFIIVILTS